MLTRATRKNVTCNIFNFITIYFRQHN